MASSKKGWRKVAFMVWMLLFGFMIYVVYHRTTALQGDGLIGSSAPAIVTTPIEEHPPIPRLWKVMRHDVVLLNFFASWCAPCQAEHPLLMQLSKEYNLHVVGVVSRDAPSRIDAFLQKEGNPYSYIGIDKMDATAVNYQVKGLPESYLIHKDGTVLAYHSGILTQPVIEEKFLPHLRRIAE